MALPSFWGVSQFNAHVSKALIRNAMGRLIASTTWDKLLFRSHGASVYRYIGDVSSKNYNMAQPSAAAFKFSKAVVASSVHTSFCRLAVDLV
jgi:hypothetical protein